jgi:N6-adenosine-specific RNA methylase IME4
MILVATYDRAMAVLAEALQATSVDRVMASRDDLEQIKLRARQIRDRALLADATEFQMRVERRLGALLAAAKDAGHLREGRPRKGETEDVAEAPATLKEIGVDKKLSMKAQRAAAMPQDEFDSVVTQMRLRMASGKAILVDPIDQAAKTAEIEGRRAAHAARTLGGGRIEDLGELALSGYRARFIGSDPQWKFLTRSAAGEGRSANVHYKTEEVDKIKQIPVGELAADDSMLGMWMVDWCPQDALDLLAHYGFKHVTTLYTWIKTNGADAGLDLWRDSTWHIGQGYWTRANPEDCWLATKGDPKRLYADVRQLIVAPLMEHSRKPDEWLARTERLCEGPYLELQARRTRPGWTTWGDELEWTGAAA